MKITVYQSHESNDQIRPMWIGINFGMNGVPWFEKSIYIDVSDYDVRDVYDFSDDVTGCSVYLEELLGDPEGKCLGINLERLYERIRTSVEPSMIERLIVQVCDVQEVMAGALEII